MSKTQNYIITAWDKPGSDNPKWTFSTSAMSRIAALVQFEDAYATNFFSLDDVRFDDLYFIHIEIIGRAVSQAFNGPATTDLENHEATAQMMAQVKGTDDGTVQ